MATVVTCKPGTGTLRIKTLTNILSCLKVINLMVMSVLILGVFVVDLLLTDCS